MSTVPRVVKNALRPIVISALTTWERMESGVAYNPTSDSVRNNPYEIYAELRSKDPIHRMRLINAWVLTRYEDVDMVLRDHRRFSNHDDQDREYRSMLFLDPPDHTRLRSLVSKAFTPRSVAELEPKIQSLVQELLDNIEGKDSFDLISDFAFPLPVTVIAEMLGVPAQDIDRFRDWSNDIALSVEPTLDDEQTRRMEESFLELLDYLEDIIERRQREPREDMITALLNVEAEGDRLSRDDLLATLTLLLVAGNETTRNFIGNGMLALLKHPDQLQRLRDNPHMLDSALNELLRYDSPVQMDQRMVYEDVEIDGNRIQAGQRVINAIGAANRDPAVFANPDELDIGRREKSHLSFGRGIHYCLGSPLAMLEGRAAFSALLDRFPSIKLVAEPEFREQVVLRGVEELWVEVE
ncbi:MAG: cytochrome P450 [Dehalococcoidia bacterium]|nr:cytochrome P450 [Dehalococcoidia bacterium]